MNPFYLFFFLIFPFLLNGTITEEGFIPIENGKIYYRAVGSGEPIFILHGAPGLDHTYLRPGMDALSEDHRLIYFDQRGTGKSTCDLNCESINMDAFVEDLESLRKAFNCRKMTLLAHSWGGLIALEYALKYPDKTKALLLMHSAPLSTKAMERFYENLALRLRPISDQLADIEASEEFKMRNPKLINRYFQMIFQKYFWDEKNSNLLNIDLSEETASNYFIVSTLIDSDYLGEFDIYDQVAKITTPTLIIHGDSDPIPEKYATEIHQAIKDSEFLLIARCGHFPFIEQPFALFRKINDFLTHLP